MVALCIRGRIREGDNALVRWAKRGYEPLLRQAIRLRLVVIPLAGLAFVGSLFLFRQLGQEFVPTLDEQDIAIHAIRIPSTSLTQSTTMQFQVEKALKAFPEVELVFSKTGTAEMASDLCHAHTPRRMAEPRGAEKRPG
jgi:cobalt-zinc-cadmium resistance protein CzcA